MRKPASDFLPSIYRLSPGLDKNIASLEIEGRKLGPPNRRIVMNQKGLKIISAKIIYHQKNKQIELEVVRINHLPSFEEVRLHTSSPLYPGNYLVTLSFSPFNVDELRQLENSDLSTTPLRQLLPSFDSQDARVTAKIELA